MLKYFFKRFIKPGSGSRLIKENHLDSNMWRPISQAGLDITPEKHEADQKLAFTAWREDPIAKAVIDITKYCVLGRGVSFSSVSSPDNLSAFLKRSRFQLVLKDWCEELSIFGELFIRLKSSVGLEAKASLFNTQLVSLNPLEIDAIDVSPEDNRTPVAYHFNNGTETEVIPANQVVHLKINCTSHGLRGNSDLATLLPWLAQYKTWLDQRVESNKAKAAWAWDVTVEDADEVENVAKRLSGVRPSPGSIIIHTTGEKWQTLHPNVQANDAQADGRQIRLMATSGSLIPEHWLIGEGGNANRSTAREMALPTVKKMEDRQDIFKAFLSDLFSRLGIPDLELSFPPVFQIDEAERAAMLAKDLELGAISEEEYRFARGYSKI